MEHRKHPFHWTVYLILHDVQIDSSGMKFRSESTCHIILSHRTKKISFSFAFSLGCFLLVVSHKVHIEKRMARAIQ